MFKFLEIVWNSLKMALSEFRSNKLRTFLSLFGITVGIFCIIGVLATVDSLKENVQKSIKSLGSNTIYIDKWDYSGQIPWWKLINRPEPRFEEIRLLKQRSELAKNVAFNISSNNKVEWGDEAITDVNIYGISEDFSNIQQLDIQEGRFFKPDDFESGSNTVVMGYTIAEKLFPKPEAAVGQEVDIYGKKAVVIGLLKKKGQSMMGGYNYDESALLVYNYMKTLVYVKRAQPVIVLQGKDNVPMKMLRDDVEGAMRSIRKTGPTQADDFALNDIESFGKFAEGIFSGINTGGWFIAGLSLIVGMFGVANIMFVTVRERTGQIGLKKAIGAKKSSIMTEFLLESAFLCILGGAIGLLLVYILTKIISPMIGFDVVISFSIFSTAITICVVTGVLAGIIPAFIAARMNPVVAIRSK
jgi:putative ABC transport system permease protein